MEDAELSHEAQRLMMENEDEEGHLDYQQHIEKIMNFQAITQTTNSDLAAKYLVKNGWDESKAAKEYYDELNRQDFANAQQRVYQQMYGGNRDYHQNPEAQALIDNPINYGQDWDEQYRNDGPSIFSVIMNATVVPVARTAKSVIGFFIPGFIKRAGWKLYSYFSPPYPSELFVENLRQNSILNAEFQQDDDTKVKFLEQYFADAVRQGFRDKKPILFIFTDLMLDEIKEILKEIFNDEDALKSISSNFLVFGLETGSPEANALSLEFSIKEIPYFAWVMAKSETEYDIIENYTEEEVELDKFKEFLSRAHLTYTSLLDYLIESKQYNPQPRNSDTQTREFVDSKHEEDRRLMEQTRREFEQAQEDDRKKLEKSKREKEQLRREEEEKRNYEQTKKDLAKRKKSELPPEPEEGTHVWLNLVSF